MPRQFTLPDLGEGLEGAEIVAWLVNEGDHVVANQPLVSVETDKAVVEIPSPWSGSIARRFGAKGDLIKVGAALVEYSEGAGADTGTIVARRFAALNLADDCAGVRTSALAVLNQCGADLDQIALGAESPRDGSAPR